MNRALKYVVTGLATVGMGFSTPSFAQTKYDVKNLIVMPFRGESILSNEEGVAKLQGKIHNEISSRLDDDFRLVDRSLLEEDLRSFGLRLDDLVEDPSIGKGKVREVDGILLGEYKVVGDESLSIDSRFIYLRDPHYDRVEEQKVEGDVGDIYILIGDLLKEFREDLGLTLSKQYVEEEKPLEEVAIEPDVVSPKVKEITLKKRGSLLISPMLSYALPSEDFAIGWDNTIGGGVQFVIKPNARVSFAPKITYRRFNYNFKEEKKTLYWTNASFDGGDATFFGIDGVLDVILFKDTSEGTSLDFLFSLGYRGIKEDEGLVIFRTVEGDLVRRRKFSPIFYNAMNRGNTVNALAVGGGLKFEPLLGKGVSLPLSVNYEVIIPHSESGGDFPRILSFDAGLSF